MTAPGLWAHSPIDCMVHLLSTGYVQQCGFTARCRKVLPGSVAVRETRPVGVACPVCIVIHRRESAALDAPSSRLESSSGRPEVELPPSEEAPGGRPVPSAGEIEELAALLAEVVELATGRAVFPGRLSAIAELAQCHESVQRAMRAQR